ncbi:MAG TPA: hypothetical protein VI387_03325 [Candidatus Brocadiales bacterium]|nr:hypothetical protein [Candidatus Brocadiales bacterium]
MIIFDASTLILLAKTDLLELFISNYPAQVLIPEEVRSEIMEVEKADAVVFKQLIESKKIKVLKIKKMDFSNKLMEDFNIEKGEAEALGLAMQGKAGVIATDDKNAMKACKFLKLEFITSISILIRVLEKGLINREEAFIKLRKLQSIGRYSKAIIADAAEQIQGRKGGR